MRRPPCSKLSFTGPRAEGDALAEDRLTTWWPRSRHVGCDVQAPPRVNSLHFGYHSQHFLRFGVEGYVETTRQIVGAARQIAEGSDSRVAP